MKISVIVPIYNVEPYLRNCLDSIRCQTHEDLEIILVDDSSPDGCAAICDEYVFMDNRFKVIHKSNGGVASARNAGLDAATGEWIGFVDPDDYIERDMYEYLLTNAIAYNADLSVCGMRVMVDGIQTNPWMPHYDEVKTLDRERAIEMYLERNMHDGCVNKLYRRELWDGLRFPVYKMAEDLLAMWNIFKRANVTVRLSDDKYVYCRRSGSATTAKVPQTILDEFNAIKKRYDEVMDCWPQFEELAARRCLISAEGAWEWYFSNATREEQRAIKPEIRKMAKFCASYWEKYKGANVGIYDFFKLKLMRCYPSRWAWTFSKLWDKLDACLWKLKQQGNISDAPSSGTEPEDDNVDSMIRGRQEILVGDQNVILKAGPQVFIFAGVHYCDAGGGQRSAQMARTFNEMGYRVYYIHYLIHPVYGEGKAEPFREGTMFNPTMLHCQVDAFSVRNLDQLVDREAFFIFEVPVDKFEPYLDYAKNHHIPTVYEHIDNWNSELGGWFYRDHIFRRYLKECTLVTVTARLLGEKVEEVFPQTEYHYLPNAVNVALFDSTKYYEKPSDLVEGKRTLLYFGALWGEWFDWDKIAYVARHCDCSINLIGGYGGLEERRKKLPRNIHFLGQKPQVELPAYLAYSDIALLPFINSEIGKYVSPLKIFEYIAMNKPVLATPLDDITGYPNVFVSDDNKEWARAVTEQQWPEITDSGVFTSQNSWHARCVAMLEYVGMLPVNPPKVSVIVSGHNCRDSIFRCVDSLLVFHVRYGCEIIVVDSDGNYEELEGRYHGKITLMRTESGSGSARNMGSRAAHEEFLFFMDGAQRVVSGNYLDSALDILRREGSIGAVGWQKSQISAQTHAACACNEESMPPYAFACTDVAYLHGSGLLITKDLFDALNGFDENYALRSFQDVDLSLRLRHRGYSVAYCPYIQLIQATLTQETSDNQLIGRDWNRLVELWEEENAILSSYSI